MIIWRGQSDLRPAGSYSYLFRTVGTSFPCLQTLWAGLGPGSEAVVHWWGPTYGGCEERASQRNKIMNGHNESNTPMRYLFSTIMFQQIYRWVRLRRPMKLNLTTRDQNLIQSTHFWIVLVKVNSASVVHFNHLNQSHFYKTLPYTFSKWSLHLLCVE